MNEENNRERERERERDLEKEIKTASIAEAFQLASWTTRKNLLRRERERDLKRNKLKMIPFLLQHFN